MSVTAGHRRSQRCGLRKNDIRPMTHPSPRKAALERCVSQDAIPRCLHSSATFVSLIAPIPSQPKPWDLQQPPSRKQTRLRGVLGRLGSTQRRRLHAAKIPSRPPCIVEPSAAPPGPVRLRLFRARPFSASQPVPSAGRASSHVCRQALETAFATARVHASRAHG